MTLGSLIVVALAIPAHLGYEALAALVGAESMGIPVPGETALLTAAVLAHQGHLAITTVIPVAASAAILGDNPGYLLGRHAGRHLLQRPGPFHRHRRTVLDRGERFFTRHGPRAVFLARFVTGARVAAAWLAGVNRMPWPTFPLYNALGGIAWALAVGLLAYLLGAVAERLAHVIGLAALLALATLALALLAWKHLRRRAPTATDRN